MDTDYCMVCGKHTLGSVYCSQSCRLSELEASILPTSLSTSNTPALSTASSAPSTPSSSPQVIPHTHNLLSPSAFSLSSSPPRTSLNNYQAYDVFAAPALDPFAKGRRRSTEETEKLGRSAEWMMRQWSNEFRKSKRGPIIGRT
ncbi:hypothetical protein SAICODRAFT_18326 [Saitoella complicata NRRL Y-17804]|uniref:uncharacterized protein n=1 Tax=Saitoella complicata (strain BCRC 22490 / CBS 7301 / JCM 7358 / NBRC 10748 / NRRL Y-17804) TaxID=698492 RepID=UPI0008682300|nr:uncharacterized protein SAICODRAFT_18326 [Saitoella complicata NRRL Y-17804]ODQ54258.1 hypothetical protein SAICODRAFT_18326 [Saitoella complicata NRRL Y-17804]